jgi:micrococcal nuclease
MYEYKCKLVKVVDGDTIDVDIDLGFGVWMRNQRIRMYGIDTPESRTSDPIEKVYGKAASAFLTKWTNAGELTLKTFKDGKGKYGRILGEIWYGGEHNVNQLLVDNNHAVRYYGQSKEDIAEEHLANRTKLNLTIEE